MSLNIYKSINEVPTGIEIVNFNDSYFDLYTDIMNTDEVKLILEKVEKAKYFSNRVFVSRIESFGGLFKNQLSTGTKTLLNIIGFPGKCFNVIECGNNALEYLLTLYDGNVLWEKPFVVYSRYDCLTCDVNYNGRHFSDVFELIENM